MEYSEGIGEGGQDKHIARDLEGLMNILFLLYFQEFSILLEFMTHFDIPNVYASFIHVQHSRTVLG